jgi:hypothetical protein
MQGKCFILAAFHESTFILRSLYQILSDFASESFLQMMSIAVGQRTTTDSEGKIKRQFNSKNVHSILDNIGSFT